MTKEHLADLERLKNATSEERCDALSETLIQCMSILEMEQRWEYLKWDRSPRYHELEWAMKSVQDAAYKMLEANLKRMNP